MHPEHWAEPLAELLVLGMHQVFIAILFAVEREDEGVGGAFVQTLGTVVGAVFQTLDLRDGFLQRLEGIDHLLDVFLARAFLEFEGDHMAELAGAFGAFRGDAGGGEGEQNCCAEE